jgi:hypothetical protein
MAAFLYNAFVISNINTNLDTVDFNISRRRYIAVIGSPRLELQIVLVIPYCIYDQLCQEAI